MKRKIFQFCPAHTSLRLGEQTQIMGIINMTPDSFSLDGCYKNTPRNNTSLDQAFKQAYQIIKIGADILDVGGESSRPYSTRVTVQEELLRVIPIIKKLASHVSVPVSIDTNKSTVAKNALDAGATIVNNIKGLKPDKALLRMVQRYDAGIVLMHMRGTPRTMQNRIHYHDLIGEIIQELKKSVEICLEIGIKSDKIIVDPGIGFGKSLGQNLEILNRLQEFQSLNFPILIGTSRKSFIGNILKKDVGQRLWGTVATVVASILNGAHIVRVHDVKEIKDAVRMTDAIIHQSSAYHN